VSFLDLLYLDDNDADVVVSAVHQWCDRTGIDFGSAEGHEAIALVIRHAKFAGANAEELLAVLLREMPAAEGAPSIGPILVVEDEPLIALDIEQTLETEGFSVEICGSNIDALDWLSRSTPFLALLDIQLKDGPATSIASLLLSRGVPFFVCSGSDRNEADSVFFQGKWLSKPCAPGLLVQSVRELSTRRASESNGGQV
jgi:CheY-like chemotaxis protein